VLKRIARTLLWPIWRFFDPRFQGVVDRIDAARHEATARHDAASDAATARHDAASEWHSASMLVQEETRSGVNQLHALTRADMEATSEAFTVLGSSLRDLEGLVEEAWRGSRSYVQHVADGTVSRAFSTVPRATTASPRSRTCGSTRPCSSSSRREKRSSRM
jgi:hypothetical protein